MEKRNYVSQIILQIKLDEIEILSKMITNFKKSLVKK